MCKKKIKNCLIQEDRKINPNAELNIKIIKKEKEKKVVVSTVGLQESYHITNFLNYQLIFFGKPRKEGLAAIFHVIYNFGN